MHFNNRHLCAPDLIETDKHKIKQLPLGLCMLEQNKMEHTSVCMQALT